MSSERDKCVEIQTFSGGSDQSGTRAPKHVGFLGS